LRLVELGKYDACVNEIVISETLTNFMKGVFIEKGIEPNEIKSAVKTNPKIIEATNMDKVANLFGSLNLRILQTKFSCKNQTKFSCKNIGRIMYKYLLLPSDSIHVITCEIYQIPNIATNNRDFERVEKLKVWHP
jgi:predicted nucleic acid-binding protein